MRVLLANSPWRTNERAGVRAGSRWPFTMRIQAGSRRIGYTPFPFFLAYSASLLEQNSKHEVKLIDAITEGLYEREFYNKCSVYKPNVIVLETSTPSITNDLAQAENLKASTGALIILVGPHSSTFSDDLIQLDYIDYIIKGEYELSLLQLIEYITIYTDEIKQPTNITEAIETSIEKLVPIIKSTTIKNLDSLPYPAWHQLPMNEYYDATSGIPKPTLSIQTSRGCAFKCNFCLWTQVMYNRGEYRQRNIDSIINEIEDALDKYPFIKGIFDEADTSFINKKDAKEFAKKYKDKFDLPYCLLGRSDVVDYETLKIMHDSGLVTYRMGVESASQDIVTNCGKGLDLKTVDQCIKWCRSLGINTHITISYGLPGETMETIQKTMQYIQSCKADFITQSIAMPYPGTEFYNYLKKNNMLETEDWSEYDGFYNAVYHTEDLTREDLNNIFRGR